MAKKKPYLRVRSAYELPLDLLREKGITTVLFDLDNTLASYYEAFIDRADEAKALKESLAKEGLTMILASNGRGKRVGAFASSLGVRSYHLLLKPFPFRLRRLLRKNGIKPDEAILVGDQLLTDMKAARSAGIYFALSDPLTAEEPFFTRINRFFERKNRKKIAKTPYNIWIEG